MENGVQDNTVLENHHQGGTKEALADPHGGNLGLLSEVDQMIGLEVPGRGLLLPKAIQTQTDGRESLLHLEGDHQSDLHQGKMRAPGDLRNQDHLLLVPEMMVIAGREEVLKTLDAGKDHLDGVLNNHRMTKAGKLRADLPTVSVQQIGGKEVVLQQGHLPEISSAHQMSHQEDVVHLQDEILQFVQGGDMYHLVHGMQNRVEVKMTFLQEGMNGTVIGEIVTQPGSHINPGINPLEMVIGGVEVEVGVGHMCHQVADQMHHPARETVIDHVGRLMVDII